MSRIKFLMFSKNIDSLPLAEAGEAMKYAGFDGVDLTVRPAEGNLPPGRVLPERVRAELPETVRVLKSLGVEVPLVTTAITSADDPHARDIFETAAECGVSEIRLGYWRYTKFGTLASELDVIERRLDGLERLAQQTGVRACVFGHQGDLVCANPLLLLPWVKDRNPAAVSVYLDMEHLTLDQGSPAVKMAFDLLGKRLSVVAVKDFEWRLEDEPTTGKKKLTNRRVPVGSGAVNWQEIAGYLRQLDAECWATFHCDYSDGHSWRRLTVPELVEQARADVSYVRELLTEVPK